MSNQSSSSRENILRKLRNGLEAGKLPMPFPEVEGRKVETAFADSGLSLEETFADAFIKLGGKFVFCENDIDLMANIQLLYDDAGWKQLLCSEPVLLQLFHRNRLDFIQPADPKAEAAEACITDCEFLVARTGSIILSSRQNMGRVASIFHPIHIVVAYASQIVADIPQALQGTLDRYGKNLPSMINLNTGPSRTADIEKTLVVGVHGPREVYCFFVNR